MKKSVLSQISAIEAMSAKELASQWSKYFDYPPQSRCNKSYLTSQIIYRIQEITYGGLSRETIERLENLANDKKISGKKISYCSWHKTGSRGQRGGTSCGGTFRCF